MDKASVTLTKTMLDKAIIDANASVRQFALAVYVDYDAMISGEKHTRPAQWLDGKDTVINFYRTNNNRADRRISIKGIKAHAEIGNTILIGLSNSNTIILEVI